MTFRRLLYVPPPPAPPTRGRMAAIGPAVLVAMPKVKTLQHAGYERLVRMLPCAHCGIAWHTQFCHSDQGKGEGIKSDVRLGWPGCGPRGSIPGCHFLIGTQRIYGRDRRREIEAEMAQRTRERILAMGLWPKSLPKWEVA